MSDTYSLQLMYSFMFYYVIIETTDERRLWKWMQHVTSWKWHQRVALGTVHHLCMAMSTPNILSIECSLSYSNGMVNHPGPYSQPIILAAQVTQKLHYSNNSYQFKKCVHIIHKTKWMLIFVKCVQYIIHALYFPLHTLYTYSIVVHNFF